MKKTSKILDEKDDSIEIINFLLEIPFKIGSKSEVQIFLGDLSPKNNKQILNHQKYRKDFCLKIDEKLKDLDRNTDLLQDISFYLLSCIESIIEREMSKPEDKISSYSRRLSEVIPPSLWWPDSNPEGFQERFRCIPVWQGFFTPNAIHKGLRISPRKVKAVLAGESLDIDYLKAIRAGLTDIQDTIPGLITDLKNLKKEIE